MLIARLLSSLLVIPLLYQPQTGLAWGAEGHRIIASVAEQLVQPKTREALTSLLQGESLASIATWADERRDATMDVEFWRNTAHWHYLNLQPHDDYEHSPKDRHGDAVEAMATFTAILKDQPLPQNPVTQALQLHFHRSVLRDNDARQFALKFAVHVIADLQQPLHCGYADDRGGNDIKVRWQGKSTNLHALWDSGLLNYRHASEKTMTRRLATHLQHLPTDELHALQNLAMPQWLDECSHLLDRIHHEGTRMPAKDYAAEFEPTIQLQLEKGAARTAAYLDQLFAGDTSPAP